MPARDRHRVACAVLALALGFAAPAAAQEAARGYAFTPVLHSVSYAGVWRGQAQLTLDEFLVKAKALGFTHVEVMGKRPHLSPLDYDAAARAKLKARLQELGLKIVCLAGYPDFTASADKMGIPSAYTTVADYVIHPRARYSAQLTNYLKQDAVVRAVPFGDGFIDYKAFFDAMKAIGYKGYVAYEMCEVLDGGGSIENLDATARTFLARFREMTK